MIRYFGFLIIILSLSMCAQANNKKLFTEDKKGTCYVYWGYNRDFYSRSNIHFRSPDYDFTVYKVKASDRPSSFGDVYFDPTRMSIPQYNYRFGYFITD